MSSAPEPGPSHRADGDPTGLQIPSLTRRLVFAVLRAIPLLLLLVVVPIVGLSQLAARGVTTPLPAQTVGLAGVALTFLACARYVARPTKAYGPLSVLGSGVALLYLWTLASVASATLSVQHNVTLTLVYGGFLLIALIVPGFGILSGLVTTVEDFARPGERVRYQYGYPR